MLLADTVHYQNSVGPGSIATIVAAIIVGYFSVKAAKIAKKTNDKVGNGWTEELGRTLEKMQETAAEAKRVAASADASARKTRGVAEVTKDIVEEARNIAKENGEKSDEVNEKLSNLTGQFDQHIKQHNWKE